MKLTSEFVGERIKKERLRLGLTQDELASTTGVKQMTVYHYEKGNRRPTFDFLLSFLSAGANLSFLIYGKHYLLNVEHRFVDADLASELYLLVDKYCVDKKGRALHVDHRRTLFEELVSMSLNMKNSEIDKKEIHKVLKAYAA